MTELGCRRRRQLGDVRFRVAGDDPLHVEFDTRAVAAVDEASELACRRPDVGADDDEPVAADRADDPGELGIVDRRLGALPEPGTDERGPDTVQQPRAAPLGSQNRQGGRSQVVVDDGIDHDDPRVAC